MTMVINGEPWFVGKDVASVLGYAKPENALARHVDAENKRGGIHDLRSRKRINLIPDSGIRF